MTARSPRTALIVSGGWEGHRPVEATDLLRPFLIAEGFEIVTHDSPECYADEAVVGPADVIVQCVTMSSISDAACEGLRAAVAGGAGLVGWHGGIADSFRDSAPYLQLVGGQFVAHPGMTSATGEHVVDVPHAIEFSGAEHPITRGLDDFELETEQYWVLADGYSTVLATTTLASREGDPWSRPVVSPAVWTREWGQGRVAVVTPGHSLEVLRHPTVRTLIERSVSWATRDARRSA